MADTHLDDDDLVQGQPEEEEEEGAAVEEASIFSTDADMMMSDSDEDSLEEEVEELMRPELPPDMAITDQERIWAKEIKSHVEAPGSDLKPLTDMQYAHHAIISQGDIRAATKRIAGLQYFRELHKVQDTVEEGVRILMEFIRLQPGVVLHTDVCGQHQEPIQGWNLAACFPARGLESEENWRIHVLCYYYLFQMQQPTLHAVRYGVVYLVEGRGMTWANFNQDYENRLHDEVWDHYPIKVRQMRVFNSNSVVNMVWSLLKPLLRQEMRNALVLGCQIDWDESAANPKLSLGDLFFLPTYEVAMQNMQERARRLLTQRYFNEKFFRL